MIEMTLEGFLKSDMQLGVEFNIKNLLKDYTDFIELLSDIKTLFLKKTPNFTEYQKANSSDNINMLLDEALHLSVAYAYYFGLDYLLRHTTEPDDFNYNFIKKGIANQDDKNDIAKQIYDKARKQLKNYYLQVEQQKDPMHINPYLVYQDIARDTLKKTHFNGQVTKYYQKIFTLSSNDTIDYTDTNGYKIQDLLPSLTLRSLEANTLLPMGAFVKDGSFSITKIHRLCNHLGLTIPNNEDIGNEDVNKSIYTTNDYMTSINCKYPKLIYDLACEDLFHINRLDNTIMHYIEYVKKQDKLLNSQQKTVMITFYSLFYYMPSVFFQDYFATCLENACSAYINGKNTDLFKYCIPLINIPNILFPQIVFVLLRALFTDTNFNFHSPAHFEYIIQTLENYITYNYDSIGSHFQKPDNYIWDNALYVTTTHRNKGFNSSKTKQKINTVCQLSVPKNHLTFEEITRYLIASEPRWRYTTILETNLAADFFAKRSRSDDVRLITICDKTGKHDMLIRYSSQEYAILLFKQLIGDLQIFDYN